VSINRVAKQLQTATIGQQQQQKQVQQREGAACDSVRAESAFVRLRVV
jgi:hypothetical protein